LSSPNKKHVRVLLVEENQQDAERIVNLAENHEIELAIPACALFEPYETLVRRRKQRAETVRKLSDEIAQLGRSQHFADLPATSEAISRVLSGAAEVEHRALDEALLHAMPRLEKPVLRFYDWTEPAASFGYFQKFAEVEQTTLLRPLVRRPTGGGIVPHDADWTYSLVFPVKEPWYALAAIESYSRVHEWIQAAFADLNVPTELAPSDSRIVATSGNQ